ncbi:EKC/KEOPS complex subunit TPRKB-like [Chrysoperla carnea]|uniref:EKC/KEOPS complex subunit TPRKB-like n=1 Tax=Chrysoperla carnea TaxID=189513 RepID=UPI001D060ECB|nr:EKC/KEOPS complex subunit TPRKB-like [Chrysoperla carnea]
MTLQEFELDPDLTTKLVLTTFTNVTNINEIRQKILNGSLKCGILKANLIFDSMQIIVAANKTLVSEKYGHMTTKNIYTELLFNLNLSKNITQSLIRFGIDDKDTNIIVVIFCSGKNDEIVSEILNQIQGEQITSFPNKFADESNIKKIYKIPDNENKVSSLIDSIVSRIATKDFVSC